MCELYFNGLRNSEVCDLDTTNVRYDAKEHTLTLQFRGKGNRERLVALNPDSASYLGWHLLVTHLPREWEGWVHELQEQSDDPVLLATDRLLRRKLKDVTTRVFTHLCIKFCRRDMRVA